MRMVTRQGETESRAEVARYVINGLLATAVHYAVLTFNLQVLSMRSAGLANLVAAVIGISVSFLGSRYFVFRKWHEPLLRQAMRFGVLYAAIACLHGAVLYGWSDVYRLDYRIGFVLATVLQVMLSYLGNKTMVFKT